MELNIKRNFHQFLKQGSEGSCTIVFDFNFRIHNAIPDKCKREKTVMYPQDSLVLAKVCLDSGDP